MNNYGIVAVRKDDSGVVSVCSVPDMCYLQNGTKVIVDDGSGGDYMGTCVTDMAFVDHNAMAVLLKAKFGERPFNSIKGSFEVHWFPETKGG